MTSPTSKTDKSSGELSKLSIIYRPYTEADEGFVFSSWLSSLKESFPAMESKCYYLKYRPLVAAIIEAYPPLLAVDEKDPTRIYGYIISHGQNIFWIYVKHAHRRSQVARGLTEAAKFDPQKAFTYYFSSLKTDSLLKSFPRGEKYLPAQVRVSGG